MTHPAVLESLLRIAGENAPAVLGQMGGTLSDEELARVCKFKVSDVRAVLNKLHSRGIAVYERTRDKDTGWYYYKWSSDLKAIERMMEEQGGRERREAESGRAYEGAGAYNIYVCGNCAQERHSFEVALDYLFKCPQCGSSLEFREQEGEPGAKKVGV